jgi:hypothetical protein
VTSTRLVAQAPTRSLETAGSPERSGYMAKGSELTLGPLALPTITYRVSTLEPYGTFSVTLCGLSAALTVRARAITACASEIAANNAVRDDAA